MYVNAQKIAQIGRNLEFSRLKWIVRWLEKVHYRQKCSSDYWLISASYDSTTGEYLWCLQYYWYVNKGPLILLYCDLSFGETWFDEVS